MPLEPDSNRLGQNAQAAVEKAMKALVVAHGQIHKKTHDIEELIDTLRGLGEDWPEFSYPIDELTGFAGEFRYEDVPSFSEAQIASILETVAAVRRFCCRRITQLTGHPDPAKS